LSPRESAPGTLDDYAFTVNACIDGWLASGEMNFYRAAVKLADSMIEEFHDASSGGFFDTSAPLNEAAAGFSHSCRQSHGCDGVAAA
jgi:uncharacterized protein YyaL (SSP411 family)